MVKDILLLGDIRLYNKSDEIDKSEISYVPEIVSDMRDTLLAFRKRYGLGRAIAAPQIGVFKRIIYMSLRDTNYSDVVFINPALIFPSDSKMLILDDCMSFPGLFINVERYKECMIHYKDINWNDCNMRLTDGLSELLQHEYDHLDGILATMRAIDNKSFVMKNAAI